MIERLQASRCQLPSVRRARPKQVPGSPAAGSCQAWAEVLARLHRLPRLRVVASVPPFDAATRDPRHTSAFLAENTSVLPLPPTGPTLLGA